MVYLYYISCSRYTILVGNPRYASGKIPCKCSTPHPTPPPMWLPPSIHKQKNKQYRQSSGWFSYLWCWTSALTDLDLDLDFIYRSSVFDLGCIFANTGQKNCMAKLLDQGMGKCKGYSTSKPPSPSLGRNLCKNRWVIVVLCWLLNIPETCQCISGTDLLNHVLPYWDRSFWSNLLSHQVTVFWHKANQSQHWA